MSLRRFMHRTRKDEDLAEEIESHLAHEQDANGARGLSGEEARRQARLKFGNPRTTRERCVALSISALARKWLARSALRAALARQDAGIHPDRDSCDRRGHRREHRCLFGDQYSAAQAAYLSRSAIAGAIDEHQPAGIVSRGEHTEVQHLASAEQHLRSKSPPMTSAALD